MISHIQTSTLQQGCNGSLILQSCAPSLPSKPARPSLHEECARGMPRYEGAFGSWQCIAYDQPQIVATRTYGQTSYARCCIDRS